MTVDLLRVRDLEVRFGGMSRPAVAMPRLEVRAGDAIGLVGESGSGKTTLARCLLGVLPPTRGSVEVQGVAWPDVGRRDQRRRLVQMIFQDPYGSLNPHRTARQHVAEVIGFWHGVPRPRRAEEAAELLDAVGLPRRTFDALPRHLSGGQCQRVGVARAMACRPDVLIADEPTSSLDVSVQAQILNLLLDLRAQRGLALVLISHDLAVVRYVTDEAHVLHRGVVVEHGPTQTLLDSPSDPYTQRLVASVPGRARG